MRMTALRAPGKVVGSPSSSIRQAAQLLVQRTYTGNQAGLRRSVLQRRLALGTTGDPLEAEADRAADRVMRTDTPVVQRQCSACQDEDEGTLRPLSDGRETKDGEAPEVVHQALAAPGEPLDPGSRSFFEQRYARDFSGVRIHTGSLAHRSAESVHALAYTVGQDIAFASGHYQPQSHQGRRLIAHELAHVVQQGAPAIVRRLGDPDQIPRMLSCAAAESNAPLTQDFFLFPNDSSELTEVQKAAIAKFSDRWSQEGNGASIRIDGFASEPGGQPHNWQLSCNRAAAVKDELVHPSAMPRVGLAEGAISLFMQGQTSEFGAEALNRRVTLSFPSPTPVTPVPSEPKEPAGPPAPKATASTSDCNADEASLITDAVGAAKTNIAAVVPQLASNPLSADMQNALWLYFRNSSPATASKISASLKKIASNLDTVTYECEDDCAENLLGYTRIGTVVTGLGNIHLCMNNLKPDAETIANTILHETAHYALQAGDTGGYFGNDCAESDTTVATDSATRLDQADSYSCFVKNWVTAKAGDRADARGDLTGANIAGIEQGPSGPIDLSASKRKPLFSIRLTRGPLAQTTGVSYRWIFTDAQDRSYRMTDISGNDLFDFKPALESVLAIFNTPTRELLKQRGVTGGTVVCRAISPLFQDKLFKLPVTFTPAAP